MMKLEEAIKHCEEVALSCAKSNKKCALVHVQLMQWLKELRVLRQLVKPEYLQEIRGLQKTWGKEWEEEFNRKLCYDVTGPFRELNYTKQKQDEQKITDNEPKFHKGDWIISNNKKHIYQVVEVKRGIYVIRDNEDNRDSLRISMTDAGYMFDFEKKELKKISQRMISAEAKEAMYDKPACVWSEEDEHRAKDTIFP